MPALLAATGAKTAGFGHRAPNRGSKRTSPSGGEFVEQDFVPDVPLADGQRLDGDGWAFTALHTPGHAPDHLCFALEGTEHPVLRRSRDGLEHQRGGAAGRQHGRLHPLAAAADGAQR